MAKKKIGLLWDSVSNNIGDQAIGLTMKRFCDSRKIEYQVINPFSFNYADYSTIVIGGGELIRALGDPFYDQYRVPGRHILNSIGAYFPTDLEYLEEYKLITVRSETDRVALSSYIKNKDISVVPCTTILMKELFPELESQRANTEGLPVIGIHINAAAFNKLPGLIDSFKMLNKKYRIVLFPFTLYQNDRNLLESIQLFLPNAAVFPSEDPFQVFKAIGTMDLMISSSLHAAIFAYLNEIPFLSNPVYPKIHNFLSERNLDRYIFNSVDNLPEAVDEIIDNPINLTQQLERDKNNIKSHLDQIEDLLKTETIEKPLAPSMFFIKRIDYNASEIHHSLSMENIKASAGLVSYSLFYQKKELELKECIQKNQLLEAQLTERDEEITSYALSKSWQITRPFRKASKILRRIKNASRN
jgi:hypothetical protein